MRVGVLELRLASLMMAKHWNRASDTARMLCGRKPDHARYYIHAAFCLHESGDTLEAKRTLLKGPKTLLEDPLFHYNMGCYSAVLGDNAGAACHLEKAFIMDETLREAAKRDSDLKDIAL